MSSDSDTLRQALYERVCESYHAVDDFRMKLLGLLPVATGTGVFLLLNGNAELLGKDDGRVNDALLAIGVFGFLFTCGLFAYELFGIKKCHYLIVAGKRLEVEMGMPGQFRSRPRELAGFINEPYASAIIYPASMAAWAFLALSPRSGLAGALVAGVVFLVGYKATRFGARRIKENQEREDVVLDIVTEHGPMTIDEVRAAARAAERRNSRPQPTGFKGRLPRLPGRLHRLVAGANRVTNLRAQTEAPTRRLHWVELAIDRLLERGDLEEDKGLLRRAKDPMRRLAPPSLDSAPLGVSAADDS